MESLEKFPSTPTPESLPDIPRSREMFRGDINDAVIQTQLSTGVEIDKGWWDSEVGNHGSTESILDRYDAAYPEYVEQHITPQPQEQLEGVDETERQEHNVEEMNKQNEEEAWEHYTPIGSDEYEQANQERIRDAKIKVDTIGDNEHSVTLVASVKVDPETGQAISGHENRPDAESMRDTEQAFAEYLATTPANERFVIYEGDARVFDDRDEAVTKAADSGLVQHLAAKEHIPTVSGEPTEAETTNIMERLGVSQEELLALYVARGLESQLASGDTDFLAGYVNFQAARLGIEGFHDYSAQEKQEIMSSGKLDEVKAELNEKVGELLPTLNELYRQILDNKDLLVVGDDGSIGVNPEFSENIGEITMDRLNWSGGHRLNEVAKLSMEMRDRVIFHRIIDAYNSGKSPLIVYGGSHVVTLKSALKTYVGSNV